MNTFPTVSTAPGPETSGSASVETPPRRVGRKYSGISDLILSSVRPSGSVLPAHTCARAGGDTMESHASAASATTPPVRDRRWIISILWLRPSERHAQTQTHIAPFFEHPRIP